MNDLKFRTEDDNAVRPAKAFRLDRANGKMLGVCAGIARYFGIDTTLVRIGFVLGTLLGFGSFILIYLAIALIAD
ncbi:PspC domain-containing protein [Qipengyuania zhejiangensis]|uniref:PspC domain-containing protein n=1 Tax=Qipengyuania zhejiangensis TaxID=3077782 RepID=UPI002D783680|nr:PspC domain-containing protein [Qipengyuania sp. Z2]